MNLTFERVNAALVNYSDKDWNYSRISLITKPLDDIRKPIHFEA